MPCNVVKAIMLSAAGRATALLVAGTHVLDEAERSLHDALCVLSQTVVDRRVLLGGGWPEMAMAHAVHGQASVVPMSSAAPSWLHGRGSRRPAGLIHPVA